MRSLLANSRHSKGSGLGQGIAHLFFLQHLAELTLIPTSRGSRILLVSCVHQAQLDHDRHSLTFALASLVYSFKSFESLSDLESTLSQSSEIAGDHNETIVGDNWSSQRRANIVMHPKKDDGRLL